MLYCDPVGYRYTRNKQEGFVTFEEIFNSKYPGYGLDANQTCIATTAKTVNFNNLWDMLKSKDPKRLEEMRWAFDGEFRFLDMQTPTNTQKVAYNTFTRSGNSYLRRILENLTGISTGANVQLHTSTTL